MNSNSLRKPWLVNIITLFPDMFPGPLSYSLSGKSLARGLVKINTTNLRNYSFDKHKTVDDYPYGGGSGMILKVDVLARAIEDLLHYQEAKRIPTLYLSPRGKLFNQKRARTLVNGPGINIICGRFEGIDQRVLDYYHIEEISLGDYILSSGDIAAYSILDACIRIIPGTMGNDSSHCEESFGEQDYGNLLEYPQYTRPYSWRGMSVPNILLSGNHKMITQWRLQKAKEITQKVRPDLYEKEK